MLVSPERSQRLDSRLEAHGSSPVLASSECRSLTPPRPVCDPLRGWECPELGGAGICARPSSRSGQPEQPETEPGGSQLSGVFAEMLTLRSVADEVPAGSKLTLKIPPALPSALLPVS